MMQDCNVFFADVVLSAAIICSNAEVVARVELKYTPIKLMLVY